MTTPVKLVNGWGETDGPASRELNRKSTQNRKGKTVAFTLALPRFCGQAVCECVS